MNLSSATEDSPPYIMKTHLRSEVYQKQIEAGKVKVIMVTRNPKDTLVSLYHFYRMALPLGPFEKSWDDFFELYKVKHLIYGDYFQWYSTWLQYKDKPNVKLVKYEDMHHGMSDVINDLSLFLGKSLSQDVAANVMNHLTFDSMSGNDMVNYKRSPFFDFKFSSFIRKGIIGDWKNYFSQIQSELIDKSYRNTIEALGVSLEFI